MLDFTHKRSSSLATNVRVPQNCWPGAPSHIEHPSFIKPRSQIEALRDGDVLLFVCLFVSQSPVKFVKLFATWQHLTGMK